MSEPSDHDGQANTSTIQQEHHWRVGDRARLKSWPRDFYRWRPGVTLKGGDEIMVLAVEPSVTIHETDALVFIHPKADEPLQIGVNDVEFSWRPEPIHIPTLIERQAQLWELSQTIQAERGLLADVMAGSPEVRHCQAGKAAQTMSGPIGLFRFKNTSFVETAIEVSSIDIIEKHEGTESRSRIVLKNGSDRKSPESHTTLMDRYDELIKSAKP